MEEGPRAATQTQISGTLLPRPRDCPSWPAARLAQRPRSLGLGSGPAALPHKLPRVPCPHAAGDSPSGQGWPGAPWQAHRLLSPWPEGAQPWPQAPPTGPLAHAEPTRLLRCRPALLEWGEGEGLGLGGGHRLACAGGSVTARARAQSRRARPASAPAGLLPVCTMDNKTLCLPGSLCLAVGEGGAGRGPGQGGL